MGINTVNPFYMNIKRKFSWEIRPSTTEIIVG